MKEKCATRLSVESKWISSRFFFFFLALNYLKARHADYNYLELFPARKSPGNFFLKKGMNPGWFDDGFVIVIHCFLVNLV